jgi:hypothetical protein
MTELFIRTAVIYLQIRQALEILLRHGNRTLVQSGHIKFRFISIYQLLRCHTFTWRYISTKESLIKTYSL